jgi:hypothetical protein
MRPRARQPRRVRSLEPHSREWSCARACPADGPCGTMASEGWSASGRPHDSAVKHALTLRPFGDQLMMDPNRNLLAELRPAGVRQEEFLEVLTRHIQTSVHESETRYVLYPANPPHELRVKFDKHGALSGVFAMPALSADKLERIRLDVFEEFVQTTEVGVGREVFFSSHPVEGCWCHRDQVHILPVPPHAPRAPMLVADHPFLIEYTYRATSSDQINGHRRNRQASTLQKVLNSVLASRIRWIGHSAVGTLSHRWSLVSQDPWEVEYVQEFYQYLDTAPYNTFSETGSLPEIAAVAPNDYYRERNRLTGAPLDLPSDLGDTLDQFFGLEEVQQDRFLHASYWLSQANQTTSFSLMLLAAVQAIEVLVTRPKAPVKCGSCGSSLGPGPTRLFNTFLDVFLPSFMKDTGGHRALYGVRSGLTHGNQPPFMVDVGASFSGINPRDLEQREIVGEGLRISRMCLRNWLNCEPFIHDHVAEAAYFIWQNQGMPNGLDKEHWRQAIADLRGLAFLGAHDG